MSIRFSNPKQSENGQLDFLESLTFMIRLSEIATKSGKSGGIIGKISSFHTFHDNPTQEKVDRSSVTIVTKRIVSYDDRHLKDEINHRSKFDRMIQ
jgi:hypothetical protein